MRNEFQDMDYFETYYFANIIHNVISDPLPYIRNMEEFHGDMKYANFLKPFPRYSSLHLFVEHIFWNLLDEQTNDKVVRKALTERDNDLWVNRDLKHHKMPHLEFREWLRVNLIDECDADQDCLIEYHHFLMNEGDCQLEKLNDQMVKEVFFLMFLNRGFLA